MSTESNDRRLVVFVLVALGALLLVPLLVMGFGMMGAGMMDGTWGGHMWSDSGMTGWAFLLVVLSRLLLLLAAVVAGGYLLYRALTRSDGEDAALEELRLAYARGDLSDEEFERRKETLEREE